MVYEVIDMINNIIDKISNIKYDNGYYAPINTIIKIRRQIRLMEDTMVCSAIHGGYIGVVNENILNPYKDLEYLKNNLKEIYKHYILDKINMIEEFECYEGNTYYTGIDDKTNMNLFSITKMSKGEVHCEYGPAYIFNNRCKYLLNNHLMEYDDWKKHPLIRKNKIKKLKINHESKMYLSW